MSHPLSSSTVSYSSHYRCRDNGFEDGRPVPRTHQPQGPGTGDEYGGIRRVTGRLLRRIRYYIAQQCFSATASIPIMLLPTRGVQASPLSPRGRIRVAPRNTSPSRVHGDPTHDRFGERVTQNARCEGDGDHRITCRRSERKITEGRRPELMAQICGEPSGAFSNLASASPPPP